MLFRLKLNRKIAMATHNIMAYRIFDENRKVLIHDCDNDGEMTAGSQLLRMLEVSIYVPRTSGHVVSQHVRVGRYSWSYLVTSTCGAGKGILIGLNYL